MDLLNVRYIVHEKVKGKISITENQNYYPRFLYSSGYKIKEGRDNILKEISSNSYDPYKYVILERKLEQNIEMPNEEIDPAQNRIHIVAMGADKIVLDVDFRKNGMLLISNIYYPEWKAIVDGKSQDIYKTNYIFQSLPVVKGAHRIEIFYQGKMLKIGAVISLLTILIVIISFGYVYFKKRKSN